jgi:outer membrane biosynthesis protein TonB
MFAHPLAFELRPESACALSPAPGVCGADRPLVRFDVLRLLHAHSKDQEAVTPAPIAKKPARTPAKTSAARAPAPTAKSVKPAPAAKPEPKARPVPASKTPAKAAAPAKPTTKTAVKAAAKPAVKETKKAAAPAPEPIETVKKKPGRPPKAADAPGHRRQARTQAQGGCRQRTG